MNASRCGSALDFPRLPAIEEPDVAVRGESVALDDDSAAVAAGVEWVTRPPGIRKQSLAVSARSSEMRKELEVHEIEGAPSRFGQSDLVFVAVEGG